MFLQEYELFSGIKGEEENPKEENKQINNSSGKVENNEIKIVENTINISSKERIKNTTIKKESKSIIIAKKGEEKPKITLFPLEEEQKEEKKEMKKEEKENNDNNNVSNNPFYTLTNKEKDNGEKKENNKELSLFGNIINKSQSPFTKIDNTKSLFSFPIKDNEKEESDINAKDKNDKKEENKNTFSLFDNTNNSLFGNNAGKSLFNNQENKNSNNNSLLFPFINTSNNPFSEIGKNTFTKSLFANQFENNKKNNEQDNTLFEGDDGGSEKSDEGDKPKTKYEAEPLKAQDYSKYSKLFNLNINNLFLYNKTDKKYVSKGSGFFSIEKTKDENNDKHQAIVVFRNHAGNKLVEGFLDTQFKKFDIFTKEFKYVVCFGIIMMNEGKPDIGFIKIPFGDEEIAKELKNAFDKAMEFIEKK